MKEIEMRRYLSCLFAIIVTGCGGGGGTGSDTGANDVLQAYVSELSYPKPTTVIRAWDSQAYVVKPVVKYLKTNPELVFSMFGSSVGVSVDQTSGNVTFAPNYRGNGCSLVELKWPKTGESLKSEVCLDKEYINLIMGLSKVGANNLTSENGQWIYTISKADPATMSFDVGLNYFDRVKNELVLSGGIFPDGSNTTCSILKSDPPVAAIVNRTGSIATLISNDLVIDWSAVSSGNYQFDVQCKISVGQESASISETIKVKLIN